MPGFEIIGEEEKKELLDVLSRKVLLRYEFDKERKGVYKVGEFEKVFAQYCGANHALAVSSGTAALRVALAGLGIAPGDEVITQGFTFVATWESILDAGAIPVFTEIDETLCMDPEDLEKKITPRTRAIIPVHMCGSQARIKEITKVAEKHGVPVVEDTAQSCGGRLNGKSLGTFGKIGTFSFDSVKTITTGEGGMIITDDRELYVKCSEYHDHGHDHNPNVGRGLEKRNFIGFNYRMMELQGALGLAQLSKLDNVILPNQKQNKAQIKDRLSRIEQVTFRNIPDEEGDTATFLIFFLPSEEKARAFNQAMTEAGAGCVYWYENTWHYYDRWEHLLEGKSVLRYSYPFKTEEGNVRCSYSKGALPRTAAILSRALCIPINIYMEEQLPKILNAVEKAARVL
ncbi:MAG: DegT/DnrJ/EryC1/StrS family aminotransferase [Deltaproteobacteria bacterium]|nr:MAG: DegT/DnrJ/EryC1/StrS family aminotransferase [Deltaproteobacteria bacterium]